MLCHYALHKLHRFPHEILALPDRERAFVWASISEKVKADKEAEKRAKRSKPSKGRKRR